MATKSNPLRKVNTRKLPTVSEDGDIRHDADIVCWLDPRGTPLFVYLLPDYVAEALGIKDSRIAEPTADQALDAYKLTLHKYQDHVRTLKAEPVIIVKMDYAGRDADDKVIRPERNPMGGEPGERRVALSYKLAFRAGTHLYERKEVYGPDTENGWRGPAIGWKAGHRMGYVGGKVLPFSDELIAKLDRVKAAINGAAQVLHEIHSADDVAAAFMALGSNTLALPAPVRQVA